MRMDKAHYGYGAGAKMQELVDELRLLCDLRDEELRDLHTQLAKAQEQGKTYFSRYDEELVRGGKSERLINSLESDNSDLRTQLAEQTHQVKLLNGIVTGMRYQVTVARNSVLLDIEQAVRAIHKRYGDNCMIDAVRTAIREIRKQGDNENDG